jgi:alpha-2-macroglobulin
MDRHHFVRRFQKISYVVLVAALVLACVLPGISKPRPEPTPTPFQEPLPPALVEVFPPDGSQIGLDQVITFYFNQPMDRDTVEAGLFGLPSGSLTWEDDSTLTFTPNQPYAVDTEITVALLTSAQSANGLTFVDPVTMTFETAGPLQATNFLPEPDTQDIDPKVAVAVTFNQPVVPLGMESDLPEAFTLNPPVNGRGEWLSTSTYIFYPEPALAGGETYSALLNTELVSTAGSPLGTTSGTRSWSFKTALPRLVSVEPAYDLPLALDSDFTLVFNQAMDIPSVEKGLSLQAEGQSLKGTFKWNEEQSVVTFQPSTNLDRDSSYTLSVTRQATAVSGTALVAEQQYQYSTYGKFVASGSDPVQGGINKGNNTVHIFFTSPVSNKIDLEDFVSITPPVAGFSASLNGTTMNLSGFYDPETNYTVRILPGLQDRWGQSLDVPFSLDFRTAAVAPELSLPYSSDALVVRPDESALYALATNIQRVDVAVSPLSLDEFQTLVGPNGYVARKSYVPQNPSIYSQTYNLASSRREKISLPLASSGQPLVPGLYYIRVTSPQLTEGVGAADGFSDQAVSHATGGLQVTHSLVVASSTNLTFKAGTTDALLWAVDLRTNLPIADAPVSIYDPDGNFLAGGKTDGQGLWQGMFAPSENRYRSMIAVVSEPGQDTFGLAISSWDIGKFGLPHAKNEPRTETYLYTDRPIYRPGQTVYFRGVVREAFNGRYELPDITSLSLELRGYGGYTLQTFELPLSPYGTVHGEYQLSAEAQPGTYRLFNDDLEANIYFEVAEYRKPEFELEASFEESRLMAGDQLQAQAQAQYYFGSPAGNLDVQWDLYDRSAYFYLPGYQTGVFDDSWLKPYWSIAYPFGQTLASGTASTGSDGILDLELPEAPLTETTQQLTLELTAQDESGFRVSAQAEALVHPGEFYIGVKPDQWLGQSGKPLGFEVFTVNWDRQPSPSRELQAIFNKVHWERNDPPPGVYYLSPTYEAVYSQVASSNLSTGPDGKARLSFTPEEPGTYILEVSGQGASTEVLLWVGGRGDVAWPRLLNDRVQLTADQQEYKPGQTANIFIPNPLGETVQALITIERGIVMDAEVLTLDAAGTTYALKLREDHAPNVFFSATLLGPNNQFRQGYLNIPVDPAAQELEIALTAEPEINQPRGDLTLQVRVSDHQGNPVVGEFSLSIVDKAVLALADPNSSGIMPTFYGNQPLAVDTGLSLAVYSGRFLDQLPGGLGGGGGGEDMVFVREQFPDTAYWNPTFITDSKGQAQVTVTLPDNLTTWLVETRGLTSDTLVGQAVSEVVTTKPLLIRPVTPRFMVTGDHVQLSAIVHNNGTADVRATARLIAEGFSLDESTGQEQEISVPANGRGKVTWWGVAGEAREADLTFSVTAKSGGDTWQDSARPALGAIPIHPYVSPHTFVTSGMMPEPGSRMEVISLPRTFTPLAGKLDVEMTASLAATLLTSLKAMPGPFCTCNNEAVLSYLLPNIETYRALKASGMEIPELQERLDESLNDSLTALIRNQSQDGGWGWIRGSNSDGYLTAYVLFGLARARQAGGSVPDQVFENAQDYIRENTMLEVDLNKLQPWELDRLTFTMFALQHSGGLLVDDWPILYGLHDKRDQLSPWAQALLALGLEAISPGDGRARDLITNLEAGANRTASSANWESGAGSWRNPGTPLYTTAVVVYALAQRDPAAPVFIDAVRYLVSNRDSSSLWGSTYESAWVILALTEAMRGLGELQADFSFSATVNGAALASGEVSGTQILNPIQASVPLEYLSREFPNALTFNRDQGLGRLYYRVALLLQQPVESVQPLNRGMDISRAYYDGACTKDCQPLTVLAMTPGSRLSGRVTLSLPNDSYYVTVDDFIPAGTELLNRALKTSQQGGDDLGVQQVYEEDDPYVHGWGWWYFNEPQFHDDRITWTADFLPAGTYELSYTLIPSMAGEFHVLPAHAWQAFFPEVQGTSEGTIFEIKP